MKQGWADRCGPGRQMESLLSRECFNIPAISSMTACCLFRFPCNGLRSWLNQLCEQTLPTPLSRNYLQVCDLVYFPLCARPGWTVFHGINSVLDKQCIRQDHT